MFLCMFSYKEKQTTVVNRAKRAIAYSIQLYPYNRKKYYAIWCHDLFAVLNFNCIYIVNHIIRSSYVFKLFKQPTSPQKFLLTKFSCTTCMHCVCNFFLFLMVSVAYIFIVYAFSFFFVPRNEKNARKCIYKKCWGENNFSQPNRFINFHCFINFHFLKLNFQNCSVYFSKCFSAHYIYCY